MNDFLHRTDTLNSRKNVTCGKQKQHWIEFQLLDEQGAPLANLPYRTVNDATRAQCAPESTGQSDANGVIRIKGLHPIPITLLIAADPLTELLQTRRLRAVRPEPMRPGIGECTPLYGPPCPGVSPIEMQALEEGYSYHYLRIGQLCDRLPNLDPPLDNPNEPPTFHFPDRAFSGFTVGYEALNRRHVLEVCPFRAWSLVLHHQADYSLSTAYNLGLMSILAYSKLPDPQLGSVEEFFEQQCIDLSRTPRVFDGGQNWPCLVTDVPFSGRYSMAKQLDTRKAEQPEGDTQLFYAISATQVLVAWRGTEMGIPAPDLVTDLTFRPVKPEVQANCEPKVPCADLTAEGSVHLGFRDAFEVARRTYAKDLGKTIPKETDGKDLFICGHSLGGALGLIHSAALKEFNPLLYTYGMPRTFTLKAVECLDGVRHFRHVNDTDLVPDVPPEAALDNWLYDLYGPLGTTLGTVWSVGQLMANPVFKGSDPFCHHGEIAMFYRAEQYIQTRASQNAFYKSRDDLGAPYYSTITHRLPIKAKLFLVPSLSETNNQQARNAQQNFKQSLSQESLTRYFPRRGNPKPGRVIGLGKHFMSKYQPYLHNQLLESVNPSRMLERQAERRQFEQQMNTHSESIPADELTRDRMFLDLHNLIGQALQATSQTEGGNEALQRFDAVADEKAYYEKIYS